MKIGVDIDDVLIDTLESWLGVFNHLTGCNLRKFEVTDWDIKKFLPPRYHDYIYSILFMPDVWNDVEPLEEAQESLEKLNNEHDVYIVTASSIYTALSKWEKFEELFPFIDLDKQLIICHDKRMIDVDILIDDKYQNLKKGDIVMTQPYNEQFDNEKDGIIRCSNWKEIRKYLNIKIDEEERGIDVFREGI